MSLDPRTPVVVGVAQAKQRPENLADAVEAVAMMEQVVRDAATDAGAPAMLTSLDHIGVVQGAWKYSDPGRLLADRVGSSNARTSLSANGGNSPQSYLNSLAARIQTGDLNSAVICGAETIWSRRRQRRHDLTVEFTRQTDVEPDERFGADVPMQSEFEKSRGMEQPVNFYPLFESAIRACRGETLDEHRDRIAELWARFNTVAVDNEYGWVRTAMTAEEIRNPSTANRMVGFPYTKAMNSNWDLDQAAAVMICSVGHAEASGVPRDRWVFPLVGTDAHDTYEVSRRRDLHSSPAITEAGSRLYALADIGPHDIDHLDLYSCFPSAVQVGAQSLNIDQSRQLTQTGGLTFAGGPLNNYVTHSIATMVDTLRDDAGSVGLVTANGGFLTKHALGLYSTEPPNAGYQADDVQDAVDKVPQTAVAVDHVGDVTVEAYTVMHNAHGPEVGLCAVLTSDGSRSWGRVTNASAAAEMTREDVIGRTAHLDADGELSIA